MTPSSGGIRRDNIMGRDYDEGTEGDSFGISRGLGNSGTGLGRHCAGDAPRAEFCIGSLK